MLVAQLAELGEALVAGRDALLQLVEQGLRLLELLHDLELLVLEDADAALEGLELVLHALEVLRVRDEALRHAVGVARAAGLDLLDVDVGLALRGAEVVDDDLLVAAPAVDLVAGRW